MTFSIITTDKTQNEIILEALQRGGWWSVQSLEDYTAYYGKRCKRVAARVFNLKAQGHTIVGKYRKFPVFMYRLEDK